MGGSFAAFVACIFFSSKRVEIKIICFVRNENTRDQNSFLGQKKKKREVEDFSSAYHTIEPFWP